MSRARAIYLVARREILERGRSRAFLISLVLTVVFLVAGIFLPKLLGGEDQAHKLGVVGTPPAGFEQALTATAGQAQLKVNVESVPDVATGEARLNDGTLDGMLVVPAEPGGSAEFVVKKRDNSSFAQVVGSAWSAASASQVLTDAGIDPATVAAASRPPTLRELEPSDPNRDTAFIFANVGVIILFIAIFTFGTWVLTGVVEEKQSRVVEVVLSTVQARDLLVGKVLGIGLLGLVQLVIIVVVRADDRDGDRAVLAATDDGLGGRDAAALVRDRLHVLLDGAGRARRARVADGGGVERLEPGLASWPRSRTSSRCSSRSRIRTASAARIATFLPPVSPMIVPLRVALGAIQPWEIVLAVIVNLAAIWLLLEFGGRVYSGAVLQTGGRMKLRDAWRASRQ